MRLWDVIAFRQPPIRYRLGRRYVEALTKTMPDYYWLRLNDLPLLLVTRAFLGIVARSILPRYYEGCRQIVVSCG
jgi:hypothetical protein